MVLQLSLKMPLNSQRMALKTTLNILNKRSFKIKDLENPMNSCWNIFEDCFNDNCNNDMLKLQGYEFLS